MPVDHMTYVILVPVVTLIVWRRVRRQFGAQPIRRKRMMLRIGILLLASVAMSSLGIFDMRLVEGLLAGLAGGAIVAVVGLRLTRFEADPAKGDCYVPNPWIGALLTALLLGRLAYKFLVVFPQMQQIEQAAAAHPGAPPTAVYSPLTMAIFGLLLGYYLVYYIGLLIHHRRFQAAQPAPDTHPQAP